MSGKPECQAIQGFEPPLTVSNTAIFSVPSNTTSSFECHTIPPRQTVQAKPCTFPQNDDVESTPQKRQTQLTQRIVKAMNLPCLNPAVNTLEWCKCGLCRQMPEEYERLCCRQNPCLSTSQNFKDKVLERAKAWEPQKHELLHNDVNETKRKQAYTWFTEWRHGGLSKGVKTPVYSCCMWAVRDSIPDKNGKYTGFVEGKMICFVTKDFKARWGKQKTN